MINRHLRHLFLSTAVLRSPDEPVGGSNDLTGPSGDVSQETSDTDFLSELTNFDEQDAPETSSTTDGVEPVVVEPVAAPPAKPVATPTASVKPQAAPKPNQPVQPAQPVVAQPVVSAAQVPTQQATQQPAAPMSAEPDPTNIDDVLATFDSERAGLEALWGQQHFTLSDQELAVLDTDPRAFVQLMGGRMMYTAMRASLAQLKNFVPRIAQEHIQKTQVAAARQTQGRNAFFTANPSLTEADEPIINAATEAFAKMYPNATVQERIAGVGRMTMAAKGLAPAAAAAAPVRRSPAFVPGGVGSSAVGGVAPAAPVEGDWVSQMIAFDGEVD